MTRRVLTIDRCHDCGTYWSACNGKCMKSDRRIETDPYTDIPAWCELEEVE